MTVTESTPTLKDGRVVAIAGPVVDVEFPPDAVPAINTALSFEIVIDGQPQEVRAEVAQQIGDSRVRRSEEHTSELQSLMRISYAVFCLKKKKQQKHQNTQRQDN